jgi:hypothetical protein
MRFDAMRPVPEKYDSACKQASTKSYFHHHPIGLPSSKKQ